MNDYLIKKLEGSKIIEKLQDRIILETLGDNPIRIVIDLKSDKICKVYEKK